METNFCNHRGNHLVDTVIIACIFDSLTISTSPPLKMPVTSTILLPHKSERVRPFIHTTYDKDTDINTIYAIEIDLYLYVTKLTHFEIKEV